jgi:hypothetical protein
MQAVTDCLVCRGPMVPHTRKDFGGAWGLGLVEYERCEGCGMVVSATHQGMTPQQWSALNHDYHRWFFATQGGKDDPRRMARLERQAGCIALLAWMNLLSCDLPWLDYGAGDGAMGAILKGLDLPVQTYDLGDAKPQGCYDVVISTSVFEHARALAELDDCAALVSDGGVLALHTWVGETVPQDPAWFYYLAPHSAFYTNAAMKELFWRWGFRASLYNVDARLWFWFKQDSGPVDGYEYKYGFMDYWR